MSYRNSLPFDVFTHFAVVSRAITCASTRHPGRTRRLSTYLLSNVESEVLRTLLRVPGDIVEIQVIDVTVLEVFCR